MVNSSINTLHMHMFGSIQIFQDSDLQNVYFKLDERFVMLLYWCMQYRMSYVISKGIIKPIHKSRRCATLITHGNF